MPVVAVEGQAVGDGAPGPITQRLREALLATMADPKMGLAVDATEAEVKQYLE